MTLFVRRACTGYCFAGETELWLRLFGDSDNVQSQDRFIFKLTDELFFLPQWQFYGQVCFILVFFLPFTSVSLSKRKWNFSCCHLNIDKLQKFLNFCCFSRRNDQLWLTWRRDHDGKSTSLRRRSYWTFNESLLSNLVLCKNQDCTNNKHTDLFKCVGRTTYTVYPIIPPSINFFFCCSYTL